MPSHDILARKSRLLIIPRGSELTRTRPCDPCEWRHPWAPVEKALNLAKDKYAIYHYKQPNGKPLSTTLGVHAERLDPETTKVSQDSCSYIYHCYEGKGHTEVEAPSGEKLVFDWEARDTYAIPSWCKIKHVNVSKTERAYLVACHDGPLLDLLELRRP